MTKARKLIARAKIKHLQAVVQRDLNKRKLPYWAGHPLEQDIVYWEEYLERLEDGLDKN